MRDDQVPLKIDSVERLNDKLRNLPVSKYLGYGADFIRKELRF